MGQLILVVAKAILNLVKPPYTSLCEIVHLVKHPTGGLSVQNHEQMRASETLSNCSNQRSHKSICYFWRSSRSNHEQQMA